MSIVLEDHGHSSIEYARRSTSAQTVHHREMSLLPTKVEDFGVTPSDRAERCR
ncbi:hypothetical protein V5E97_26325 [Singulisphaera sp. Ch08]|uniref:Uncharacterized protein n=1 Tax=Singulisphaera sp. Ch08 TaxID=3120278 RepID=A0AAU7C9Q4_9BACT